MTAAIRAAIVQALHAHDCKGRAPARALVRRDGGDQQQTDRADRSRSMSDTDDLMALDLECRLTIAYRIGCECAPYLARRREVLLPAVIRESERTGADPVDTLAGFMRKVHQRHLSGLSIGADA